LTVFLDVTFGALESDLAYLSTVLAFNSDNLGALGLDGFKSAALLEDGFWD